MKIGLRHFILAGALPGLVAAAGGEAGAAEGNQDNLVYLAPIVVTAEKMEQDVQRVPASVTAITRDDIEEKHVQRFYDLTEYTPNVFIKKNSTENIIAIRGISPESGSLYSATGMYVDGVNYPIHQTQDLDFLDVERVEVLKGPQGTLYGRNAEAGVVNVITAQPTADAFGGRVFADIGKWESRDEPILKLGGVFNLPLVEDKLAAKIALQGYNTAGWTENVAPGGLDDAVRQEHYNGHGALRWTPTDAWDISFILRGQHKTDGIGAYRNSSYPTGRNEIAWDGPNYSSSDADSEVLKIEHHGESLDITSVTARHSYSQNYAYDMDMSPDPDGFMMSMMYGPGFEVWRAYYDVESWSEEFRVASRPGEGRRFDWLAGLYLYTEELKTANYSAPTHVAEQDNTGAALFGQGTLHMTDRWHLNAGARVEFARLEGKKRVTNYSSPSMDPSMGYGVASVDHLEDTVEDTVFLPSVGMSYDITDDVMAYVKVSRGYLSGGFDNYFSNNPDLYTYDPEYSWNYEAGIKSRLLDDRLIMNLAAFYIDSDDKQVVQYVNFMERYFANAASAESYGLEFDMRYRPVRGLTLTGSLGLMHSEIKDWTAPGYQSRAGFVPPVVYDGKRLPSTPEFSYTFGAVYRWESGWYVGADLVGVSSYYTSVENTPRVDGRALVHARAGYEGDHLGVMLWARNLFNEDYQERILGATGMSGPYYISQQGEPLSFGVLVQYKW